MSLKRLLVAVVGVVAAAGLLVVPPVAAVPSDEIVSANPSNHTPNVHGPGAVNSLAVVGDTVVAGGKFASVGPPGSSTAIARTNLFAFDRVTGAISPTFVPAVDGVVNRVVDSGDGHSVYVAGVFNNLAGTVRRKVARIDVTTGQVLASFKPPALNGKVNDMVLRDGVLYLSGGFTKVGQVGKDGLVALDATTGADTGRISLQFEGTFQGGSTQVRTIDVSPDSGRLVAIGNFRTIAGQSRVQAAVVDLTTTPATLSAWSTTRYSTSCSQSFDSPMRDVSISPDGSFFVIVTTGAFAGGAGSGTLCDAAARFELVDQPTQHPSWVDYTGGDTLYSVQVVGDVVHLGGHQRWLNNPFAADRVGPGAVRREGMALLDARNGLPYSWNPGRQRGVGLREFVPTADGVWIAHDTDRLGGEERKRIAFMPATGQTIPEDRTGELPGTLYAAGPLATGSDLVSARATTRDGVTGAVEGAGGGLDWSSSRGSFMVDGVLYTGWSNGTLTARTFDGATYGAASTVGLNGLTAFAQELAVATGMFFDRDTGRLYFTLSGSNRLYYRYFLPESRIVGAVRFDAGGPVGGLDWARAGGMVLAGGELYVTDRVSGTLSRVSWDRGVTGTAGVISGPGVDAHDWRARSVFLLAV